MNRRRLALWCAVWLLLFQGAWAQTDKHAALPPIFEVSLETKDRLVGDNEQYIYQEFLLTTNQAVNQDLRRLVEGMDLAHAGQLPRDERRNARRNNRLDIETTYSFSGESLLSCLVTARMTVQRRQLQCPFACRVYDLKTGARVALSDLMHLQGGGLAFLQARIRQHLLDIFPGEERSQQAIAALLTQDAIQQASFTLGGMELTLHYEARALFPAKTGLIHVRFFYPELASYLTSYGKTQTDNRRFKMVAITCDDGPRHVNSVKSLNALRKGGARATFFVVGKLFEDGQDILQRQFDANHIIASHGYEHWSGYSFKRPESRVREAHRNDAFTQQLLGEGAALFRAPGGTYPPWVEAGIGLPIIQWSVDTYDFRGLSVRRILDNVQRNLKEGDIILMHDTGETLHKALPRMCQWLWANGFMPVSVPELAWAQGVSLEPDTVYHRFYQGDYSERRDSNTN